METTHGSPRVWRENPSPVRFLLGLIGLTVLFSAAVACVYTALFMMHLIPYDLLIWVGSAVLVAALIAFSFLANTIISGRAVWATYNRPIKYPALIAYLLAGGSLLVWIIRPWLRAIDILNIFNGFRLGSLAPLPPIIIIPLLLLAVEWDRCSQPPFTIKFNRDGWRYHVKLILLMALGVEIILAAGAATQQIDRYLFKIAAVWQNGDPMANNWKFWWHAYFSAMNVTLGCGCSLIIAFLLFSEVRLSRAHKIILLGTLLLLLVPYLVVGRIYQGYNRRYNLEARDINRLVGMKTSPPPIKTLLLFNNWENRQWDPRVIQANLSGKKINRGMYSHLALWGRPPNTFYFTEENAKIAAQYLDEYQSQGPYASSLGHYISAVYFLSLKPETGIAWMHRLSKDDWDIPGMTEFGWLARAPARDSNRKLLLDYLDSSRWVMGPRIKMKFARALYHQGLTDKAQQLQREALAEQKPSRNEQPDDFSIPPLITGEIFGALQFTPPLTGPVRLGLLCFSLKDLKKDSLNLHVGWTPKTVQQHLIDALELPASGEFRFTDLGEGIYILVALADPAVIPSDPARLKFEHLPQKIALTREQPVANLGTIEVRVN